jgi:hypothetical protein
MNRMQEAKRLTKSSVKKQIQLQEKLVSLSDSEMDEYNNWFKSQTFFTIEFPKRMIELSRLRNKRSKQL